MSRARELKVLGQAVMAHMAGAPADGDGPIHGAVIRCA